MSAQRTAPARSWLAAETWTRFRQRPEWTIARQMLLSHLRSGWLWGEALVVLAVYAVFFDYPGTTGDIVYLSGFAGRVLTGLAALSTVIMVRRAFLAHAYLPLARLSSRGTLCAWRVPGGRVFAATALPGAADPLLFPAPYARGELANRAPRRHHRAAGKLHGGRRHRARAHGPPSAHASR